MWRRSSGRAAGAAAVALCVFAAAGCAVRKPGVSLGDIKLKGLSSRSVELALEFEVYNPNVFDIRLRSLEYGLSAGGEELLSGEADQPLPVLKGGQKVAVRTASRLEYASLAELWRRLRTAGGAPYEMTGRAVFDVLGVSVPVGLRAGGRMHRVRLPRWKVKSVRAAAGGQGLEVILEVTNPNSFALPMTGLAGQVRCDGQTLVEVSRPSVRRLEPGQTADVAIPVRISAVEVARAVTRAALAGPGGMRFEADLRLDPPISLSYRALLDAARGEK